MADRVVDGGRRRSRGGGGEAAKRADALERLKAIRQGNRSDFQVKIQEPIYDTVEEKDYAALVSKRRQESGDFIVDDDGLGYVDKGEEEDWSITGLPPSSDESGDESEKPKKRRPEKKNPTAIKPPPSVSSAGNRRLSAMFTSSVLKKPKEDDRNKGSSLLDEIMASEAVDEVERQKRRRGRVGFVSFTPIAPCSVKREGMPGVMSQMGLNPCANSLARMGVQWNVDSGGDKDVVVELKHEAMVDFGDRDVVVESKDEKMVDFGENSDGLRKTNGSEINGSMVSEAPMVVSEAKVTPAMKMKDEEFALNARVKGDADPALSATAGWQEVCNVENGNTCDRVESNDAINSEQKSEFELDSDGSMPFYIIDAHEEFGSTTGNLYLFGKVKTGSTYHSCCVVVKNMQRCVYAIPKDSVLQNDVIGELEKDVAESRISPIVFRTKLHELTSGLKSELREKLLDLNVSKVAMSPVKRSYAFERSDIPIGEHYVLKICYLFKDPPLPTNLKGEQFSALLGTHSSALELFLIKRKIKGPSWLSISKFTNCSVPQRVSWCKFEVTVEDPKDIRVSSSKTEVPSLIVSAINLKTIVNEKHNVNEIVAASVVFCRNAKIDTPTEWDRLGGLGHFSVVRKLDGGIFPMGFTKEVTDRNSKAGINVLAVESSERALLNRLMLELHRLDSDVLVGHNISGFDLDVLLHRAQACKVPSSMWSKIGRLKRSAMPKLTKGGTIFGSGASLGIMSCISGRLLCDTYLCSRDLLKEVSYSLTHLAKTQLGKDRKEIAPHDTSNMFQSSGALMQLIECGETDAWLSMGLMFHLSVLPLTRQLTNISGNLWGKTLQGARAQRVEYLLLHAFHAKKYIVPDKISAREKETSSTKRRIAHPADGDDANDMNGFPSENDFQNVEQGKSKKGPAYAGGLVLEPKKGLYDKYILLLDFNSLYPSIIQEYNICFTTVERSTNESIPHLPTSKTTGVLPELLRNLVERRKQVKTWLKKESGLKAKQYDIQQQALKLTANSMYGCLGFSNSRFYAKPLAELITLQGREILQSTVDLVQNNLNLEVIYGDTDSIMIYSGLDDIANAKSIAGKVIQEVNKKYRCLEIDLDGLYKRMLLLKKKKYAAVKVQFENGKLSEVTECKGLDMVRRDWSLLSKELGNFCLHQILSGGSCEDVVESIHSRLMKDQDDMRNGRVELEKYVITKTLTKPPEAYPDAKNQSHVQVALRLKAAGYSTECSAGDTVRYVICCEQGTSSTSKGIAHRARHPDELTKGNGNWIIDIDYYLAQQIHPVVSRLCAPIQGTSPARLADCLGLDSSKFQSKTSETVGNSSSPSLLSIVDDEERYSGCDPLRLSCPTCSGTFECPSVSSFMLTTIGETATVPQAEKEFSNSFWRTLRCSKCPSEGDGGRISPVMISNQVKQQADGFISMYYKSLMMCDDETCKYTTRGLNLRVIGESEKGTICPNYPRCNGHLIRKYTEVDLYKQLAYFCHVLDAVRFVEKLDLKTRMPFEKELARIQQEVGLAASIVQKIRDRCAYGWIQMKDLTISF